MKQLESDIERPVCGWARDHGLLHRKLNGEGNRHWPDQEFFIPGGRPLLVEFKRPGEKPSQAQRYVIRQLQERGYDVRWTDNKHAAIQWLKDRIEEARQAETAPPARLSTARSGVERRARRKL
jgi:hypothetical protein